MMSQNATIWTPGICRREGICLPLAMPPHPMMPMRTVFSFPMRKILLVQLYLYLSRRHRPPKEGQYHCTASGTFFQWVSLLFSNKVHFRRFDQNLTGIIRRIAQPFFRLPTGICICCTRQLRKAQKILALVHKIGLYFRLGTWYTNREYNSVPTDGKGWQLWANISAPTASGGKQMPH